MVFIPSSSWVLLASDSDWDNCLWFRFGHQRQVNRQCPLLVGHRRFNYHQCLYIWIWDNYLNLTRADPGFPVGGGANSPGGDNIWFCQILLKTAWNWKDFGPKGGSHWGRPRKSATADAFGIHSTCGIRWKSFRERSTASTNPSIYSLFTIQWRIQDFPEEGSPILQGQFEPRGRGRASKIFTM